MEISAKQWWHDELSGLKHLQGQHDQSSHGRGGRSQNQSSESNNLISQLFPNIPFPLQISASYELGVHFNAKELRFYDFDGEKDREEAFTSLKETYDDLVERFSILAEMPPLKRLNIVGEQNFGDIHDFGEFSKNIYAYGKPKSRSEVAYSEGTHSRYAGDSVISISRGRAGYQWNQESKLQLGEGNIAVSPKDIFRHEFGHFLVSTRDQKTVDKINDVLGGLNFSPYRVSAYAATSDHELLAESFAAYTHPKYNRGQLPKQIEGLLDDLLGKPKAKNLGLQMFKHLSGQHDQQSHAGEGSGGDNESHTEKEWSNRFKELGIIRDHPNSFLKLDFSSEKEMNLACNVIIKTHLDIIKKQSYVKELLAKIPVSYMILVGKKDISDYSEKDYSDVGGKYDKESEKLIVSRGSGSKDWDTWANTLGGNAVSFDGPGIYRHELGHHIFNNISKIDQGFKAVFSTEYRKISSKDVKKSISVYGATNLDEGFCESFSAYTNLKYHDGKSLPKNIEDFFDKNRGNQNPSDSKS